MELLILFGLVILNGLFVLSEMSLVSARRTRLQTFADNGDENAKTALQLMEHPDRMLSTVQMGITFISVMAGVFGGSTLGDKFATSIKMDVPVLKPYADAIAAACVVGLTTYLSLVIGEIVPKRIALQDPERFARIAARPMKWVSRIGAPLVGFLTISSNLVIRLIGSRPSDEPSVTEVEVLSMIEQGIEGGVFEASEQEMVQGVMQLDERLVRQIITPRTNIVWFDVDEDIGEVRRKMAENTYSAYPVCREDIDDVIGVVHSKDVALQLLSGIALNLEVLMKKPLFVPETVSVAEVVRQFKQTGMHSALVVGEHGGIEGMVTLTDIVEEIIGDVESSDPMFTRREDGSYLIDATMPMDRFKELFSALVVPHDESGAYQSAAGFVLTRLGRIPQAGDFFQWHKYRIEVVDMDGVRIDKLLVQTQSAPEPPAAETTA
jgi:putative hemolysin